MKSLTSIFLNICPSILILRLKESFLSKQTSPFCKSRPSTTVFYCKNQYLRIVQKTLFNLLVSNNKTTTPFLLFRNSWNSCFSMDFTSILWIFWKLEWRKFMIIFFLPFSAVCQFSRSFFQVVHWLCAREMRKKSKWKMGRCRKAFHWPNWKKNCVQPKKLCAFLSPRFLDFMGTLWWGCKTHIGNSFNCGKCYRKNFFLISIQYPN